MSWAKQDGAEIESPRRPRCPQFDALADWVRAAKGTRRLARHRAYRTWLLKVGGLETDEIARGEDVDVRAVSNRVTAVEDAISSFREPHG